MSGARKALLVVCALMLLIISCYALRSLLPAIIGNEQTSDTSQDSFPVLIRTNGGLLEVGTIHYRNTYKLKNVIIILGKRLPFCAEEASVTIDPYITYRVRLAKQWTAEYRKNTLYVRAPALEPALPVAFDTSHLESQLTKCWFLFSRATKEDLLRSLSGSLEREAMTSSHINFARDHGASDTVREFIQKWLIMEKGGKVPVNTPIEIAFRDKR